MLSEKYYFSKKLIVRSPSLSLDIDFSEDKLTQLLSNTFFLESIYIASPELHTECLKFINAPLTFELKKKKKLYSTLTKYYLRMTTRSTPFGLFSGCSITEWGKEEKVKNTKNKFKRNTRLDMHYICMLAEHILAIPEVKYYLTYFPNSSLYNIGENIRYVEYKYVKGFRSYQISAIESNNYIVSLIDTAKKGATYTSLLNQLQKITNVKDEEAKSFLDEMIDSQVLVSELEPSITGEPFDTKLVKKIQELAKWLPDNITIQEVNQVITNVIELIRNLDEQGINEVSKYKAIIEKLKLLNIPFEEGKLFQVDQVSGDKQDGPSISIQNDLIDAVNICNIITKENEHPELLSFKQKFIERYASSEQPLLTVLDPECGIGFGSYEVQDNLGDLDGVFELTNKQNKQINWNRISQFLNEKIITATRNGSREIFIEEKEIQSLIDTKQSILPPSMSILFRQFFDDTGKPICILESCNGSSAISLLARFAQSDKEIEALCREIADEEQQLNGDIQFAEIVHLPERRTGNILLHPNFREYEIPYLATSSVSDEKKTKLENLMISIVGGRIILRDKTTDKEIMPRLSSAHNFSSKALPIYNFLGVLQSQSLKSYIGFSWGEIRGLYTFYPRVTYKNIILSVATWELKKNDFSLLLGIEEKEVMDKMFEFIFKNKLPKIFYLTDGDNELLINIGNRLSVQAFVDSLKNRNFITLKELPLKYESSQEQNNALSFTKQYIAPIIKKEKVYRRIRPKNYELKSHESIQRRFIPGQNWVYAKMYCGMQQANYYISTLLQEIVLECKTNKLIDKWFFIRYSDPGFHLRLRIHVPNKALIQSVINLINEKLVPHISDTHIWKIQYDTYDRELERYGSNTIEVAESFFCTDSEAVSNFQIQLQNNSHPNTRTFWLLRAIDDMLTEFNLTLFEKETYMERLRNNFADEFKVGKQTNEQIDIRYRKIKKEVENVLSGNNSYFDNSIVDILEKRKSEIRNQAKIINSIKEHNKLTVSIDSILTGFIHMTCNRLFTTHARRQEMIMYDYLYRYYKSRNAIIRANEKLK